MSTQRTAYVHGVMTKLAEQNIDPAAFVSRAAESGNPALVKMAQLIVESVQQTKTAGGMRQTMGAAQDFATSRLQALRNLPRNTSALFNGDVIEDIPGAAGARPVPLGQRFDPILDNQDALTDEVIRGIQGAGMVGTGAVGLGAAGIGAAGLAYGMGDADTLQNKLRNASNEYLGTDFDTESRLRHILNNTTFNPAASGMDLIR